MASKSKPHEPFQDLRCPFCGKADCFDIVVVGQAHFQGRGKCGFSSKLYTDKQELRLWWNTRGGRRPERLVKEIQTRRSIQVVDRPILAVNGRPVGGSDAGRRRAEELAEEARSQNFPRDEIAEVAARARRDSQAPF